MNREVCQSLACICPSGSTSDGCYAVDDPEQVSPAPLSETTEDSRQAALERQRQAQAFVDAMADGYRDAILEGVLTGGLGWVAVYARTVPVGRMEVIARVVRDDGTLNTSVTVANQLADGGDRRNIPLGAILEVIAGGERLPDPQGVPGQFMYRQSAQMNNSSRSLEVLIHEPSGQIRHVLYRIAP